MTRRRDIDPILAMLPELVGRRRVLATAGVALALLLASLDQSMVATSRPASRLAG
jgi:hypothetical protein